MIGHHGLAHTLGISRKFDEAEVHAKRALELAEKLRGPKHPDTAEALFTIANLAAERQDFKRADEVARRALAIADGNFGPDHPFTASIHANLGIWANERKDHKTAATELRGALAVMSKMPDSPSVAVIQTALGDALVAQGKRDEGIRELEAALELREKIGDEPIAIADSQFTLARALWPTKRERALTLARAAVATFAKYPDRAEPYLPGLRSWVEKAHVPIEVP